MVECEPAEVSETESYYAIVGKIVNTAAEERVLSENGKVDPAKLRALGEILMFRRLFIFLENNMFYLDTMSE